MKARQVDAIAFAVMMCVAIQSVMPRNVLGQAQCSDPSIDNLRHLAGTETAALGSLGHVEKRGAGPVPMILIPGAAFGWRVWEDFMDRNVDAYTMYAITPAGYDGTAPPPMPADGNINDRSWTDALCGAIVELIEREKLERPIVVGHHQLGDHYAMRIAVEDPDSIRGVAIVAGSPSWAFAGPGNKPGTPVKLASERYRENLVRHMSVPFYRTVTPEMWRAGSWQPEQLSRDKAKAKKLFKDQVAVPIPTQVRYLVEYMASDVSTQFADLRLPKLIVQPKVKWTLDLGITRWKESNIIVYGSVRAAKEQWGSMLEQYWGDIDTGVKWTWDSGYQWEQLRDRSTDMKIQYIEDCGIFVMEDQPEQLDAAIRAFVQGIK